MSLLNKVGKVVKKTKELDAMFDEVLHIYYGYDKLQIEALNEAYKMKALYAIDKGTTLEKILGTGILAIPSKKTFLLSVSGSICSMLSMKRQGFKKSLKEDMVITGVTCVSYAAKAISKKMKK